MARRPSRDLTVGALFALALIILALGVMAVGGESGVFFKRTNFFVVFPGADGLLVGAPVKMAGVEIGTVSDIHLPTDPSEVGIRVEVAVDPSYAPRIRDNSRATLRILQLLTNEKFVDITPGNQGQPLAPGSLIPPDEDVGVFEKGEAIAENLSEITVALKNVLGPLERGEGLIGQMLQDPSFGDKGLEALGGTLENMKKLTGDLLAGKGTMGRLLYDKQLAATLDDLQAAVDAFVSLVEVAGRTEGALGELIEEGGAGHLAVLDLRDSAASLKNIVQRIEEDQGLLGRLINDPDYSEALANDLGATVRNVAEITEKINRGEGSLGALVNESVLHDGAEDIVAGVNDSKFARWLLRHYRKKGIKTREEGKARDAGAPEDD